MTRLLVCAAALALPLAACDRPGQGTSVTINADGGNTLGSIDARSGEVTTTAAALDALEAQPGGSWILGMTAAGLMAFGAFAFVEARWRRIRPPRDLSLG